MRCFILLLTLVAISIALPSDKQSPINLNVGDVREFPPFMFGNFSTGAMSVAVENLGHTVEVALPPWYTFMGGGLTGTYVPQQMHFHWDDEGYGSEHAVFGQKYPVELHVVAVREEMSISEALVSGERDAMAVLSFFMQESSADNRDWDVLFDGIRAVSDRTVDNSSTLRSDLVLSEILDNGRHNFGDFFRYYGSLTTSPYSEVIAWTVFRTPITIGTAQLATLRNCTDYTDMKIGPNYRSVQSRNGRRVVASSEHLAMEQMRMFDDEYDDHDDMHPASKAFTVVYVLMSITVLFSIGAVIFLAMKSAPPTNALV